MLHYTRKVKIRDKGSLVPRQLPWPFLGDIPPESRSLPDTWEEVESPCVPSSLCPVRRDREALRPARGTHRHLPRPPRLQLLSRERRQGGPERRRGVSGAPQTAPLLAQLGERRAQVGGGGRERPASRTRRRASGQRRRGGPQRPEGEGRGFASRRGHVVARPPVFNVSVFARPGLARGGAAETRRSAAGQGRGARWGLGGRWREDCVPRRSPGSW